MLAAPGFLLMAALTMVASFLSRWVPKSDSANHSSLPQSLPALCRPVNYSALGLGE